MSVSDPELDPESAESAPESAPESAESDPESAPESDAALAPETDAASAPESDCASLGTETFVLGRGWGDRRVVEPPRSHEAEVLLARARMDATTSSNFITALPFMYMYSATKTDDSSQKPPNPSSASAVTMCAAPRNSPVTPSVTSAAPVVAIVNAPAAADARAVVLNAGGTLVRLK